MTSSLLERLDSFACLVLLLSLPAVLGRPAIAGPVPDAARPHTAYPDGSSPDGSSLGLSSPDPATLELLVRLERSAQATRTLTARFLQRKRIALFRQAIESRGRLFLERGGRLRWEYTAPDASVLVVDGQRITLRVEEDGQPQVFDLARDPALAAVFADLRLFLQARGLGQASREYRMRSQTVPGGGHLLLLEPTAGPLARAMSRIELRFAATTLLLQAILVLEKSGDTTEISFSEVQRNLPIPERQFQP